MSSDNDWAEFEDAVLFPDMPRLFTNKYILDGHTPVPTSNLMEWATHFETDERQVAHTVIDERYLVSTIFMALDMNLLRRGGPPVLFETMVEALSPMPGIPDEWQDFQDRYCTWEEAEAGHAEIVREINSRVTN